MKKYLLTFLTLGLLLCEASFSGGGMVFADDYGTCEDSDVSWTYNSTSKKLTISGTGAMPNYTTSSNKTTAPWKNYVNDIKSITIANTVTGIGNYAFYKCVNCTTVTYTETSTVETIGNYAFAECSSLTSITIPSTVTTIGLKAFYGAGLTSVTIPENVEAIGDETFNTCPSIESVIWKARNCSKCINSLGNQVDMGSGINPFYGNSTGPRFTVTTFTFGDEVEIIPPYVCYKMSGLTSVSIPASVTTIGAGAFGSTGLTSFTLPNTVTSFATSYAFQNWTTWTSITLPDYITEIGDYAFDGCTALTAITIPTSVTRIGKYAFQDCTALTSITIPSSVTTIDNYAFKGAGLTSISIPNSVTSLGTYVFQGCTSLASVSLPSEITSLGNYLFDGCTGLTAITIPDNVSSIGTYVFKGCSNLTSITFPTNLSSIGSSAFKECSKITSLTIPNSVTSIGTNAFQNCTTLEFISLPSGITTISNYTFEGCLKLKAIDIPEGVTSIGTYAFQNCTTLVRVHFPSTLTKIDDYAFRYTTALTSIPLASATNLKTIGTSAFELTDANATATGILVIPSTVTTIKGNAFKNRSGITRILIRNSSTSTWTTATATSFDGMSTNIPVYTCNATCNNHYKNSSTTGWNHFASGGYTYSYTISFDCGSTSGKLSASLDLMEGSMTFTGTAYNMANYTQASPAPWNAYKQAIKSITINSYVKTIGNYAFYDCPALTTVTTTNASALTTIGTSAFMYCKSLKSIAIPAKVTSIETNSFMYCALSDITWNAENYTKSSNASSNPFWYACSKEEIVRHDLITSFTFGSGVTYIPPFICYGMTGLTSISIPSSVTTIAGSAFSGCSSLESVILPTSLSEIKSGAFGNCNALTSVKYAGSVDQWCGITFGNVNANPVYFAHGLKLNNSNDVSTTLSISASSIGKYAFAGYTDLTAVTFSSGVGSFGTSAFTGCTGLTSVRFNGTLAQWCDNTFANADANPLKNAQHFYLNSATELINLEIPEAINSIADFAFYNGTGFESISVYSTTSWGANTFTGCVTPTILGDVTGTCGEHLTWRLNGNTLYIEGYGDMYDYANNTSMPWYSYRAQIQNVEFVDEATSVGNYAFNGLTNIQSVTFGSGITTIGEKAFYGCSGLTSTLTLGDGVERVGNEAFENCTGLTSLILNDGIEELDYKAFYGCSNLLSITVPTSLDTCGGYVFSSSGKIAAVYYQGSVDQWCGIKFNTSSSNPANNSIAKLYVDSNTETYLTSATITVSTIGAYAFYDNKELTSVVITSATSVGYDAFHGCNKLARLEVRTTTPPTTASGNTMLFFGVDKTIPFYIPAAGASAYADAARWSDFADNRFLFGSCSENLSFVFAEATGILTISGSGAMTAFGSAGAVPWYSFRSDIKAIVLESGVTTIGNYAFYGCNNASFTSISIPEGVTSLGNSAFNGCTHLASVTLPSTLTTIGSNVFLNNAITSISIPNNVTSIGSGAFKGNAALTSVGLEGASQLTSIGNSAFENCSSLTSVTIPNKVTSIGNSTFSGCSALAAVTYGDAPTLATIGYSAFKNCTTLTSITIPESVTTITGNNGTTPYTPFSGCENLTTVIWNARNCGGWTPINYMSSTYYQMPFEGIKTQITSFTFGENVVSVPNYLCHGMTGLSEITIPASVTSIGANAFNDCSSTMSVTCEGTTPPTLASGAFSSPSTKKLYLPHDVAAKAAYRAASGWSSFTEANTFPKIVQFSLNEKSGDAIDPQYFDNLTSKASVPSDDPSADYYTFGGWYENAEGTGSAFAFSTTNITADKILYAKWTEDLHSVTVAYKCGEATIQASGSVSGVGVATAQNATVPEITGYTFSTWSAMPSGVTTSDELTSATISINATADGQTITANYTINSYDVTFDLQGHGSSIAVQSVNYNGLVSEPSDPAADYYTFGGWFKEAGCSNAWDFAEDKVTDDLILYAKWTLNGLALDENADNSSAISAYNGQTTNVTMTRSLTNAQYNTFCLPFSLSAAQMAEAFGAGYDLEELTDVTYEGETLALEFTQREALEAGKPYLLQPANNAVNPSFSGVEISNAAPSDGLNNPYIEYRGVYSPASLEGGNHNLLFLGAGNELFWPASNGNLKGFRAYFIVKSPALGAMRARIVKKEDSATGIDHIQPSAVSRQKYIKDGILYIERDGKTFNAQGQRIK